MNNVTIASFVDSLGSVDLMYLLAVEKTQNYEDEETTYIYADGSAIVVDSLSSRRVLQYVGRNVDNEQL
jgi:hypothetical protein